MRKVIKTLYRLIKLKIKSVLIKEELSKEEKVLRRQEELLKKLEEFNNREE